MRIVTDSSILMGSVEGRDHGLTVLPLSVSLAGSTWLEYDGISSEEFLEHVRSGELPTSSSPPPALILEAYDTDEEIIHLSMADGLSGAFEVASGLRSQARHPERVHILNTRTLCVPHRVLAFYAEHLAKQGESVKIVIEKLHTMIESAHSYLIPEDFDFLRRGGRLTPLAAKIVTLLKAVPVLDQTKDGKRLERFSVARKFDKAVEAIVRDLKKWNVNDNYYIGISHADEPSRASRAKHLLAEHFPLCKSDSFNLSPAFITQGGPGCVAIQVIDMTLCPSLKDSIAHHHTS